MQLRRADEGWGFAGSERLVDDDGIGDLVDRGFVEKGINDGVLVAKITATGRQALFEELGNILSRTARWIKTIPQKEGGQSGQG
jgi:hypothetical protein